jgi:hypothetical protein
MLLNAIKEAKNTLKNSIFAALHQIAFILQSMGVSFVPVKEFVTEAEWLTDGMQG